MSKLNDIRIKHIRQALAATGRDQHKVLLIRAICGAGREDLDAAEELHRKIADEPIPYCLAPLASRGTESVSAIANVICQTPNVDGTWAAIRREGAPPVGTGYRGGDRFWHAVTGEGGSGAAATVVERPVPVASFGGLGQAHVAVSAAAPAGARRGRAAERAARWAARAAVSAAAPALAADAAAEAWGDDEVDCG